MHESYLKTELHHLNIEARAPLNFTTMDYTPRRDVNVPLDFRLYAFLEALSASLALSPAQLATALFEAALSDTQTICKTEPRMIDPADEMIEEYIRSAEIMETHRRRIEAIRSGWRASAGVNRETVKPPHPELLTE